MRHAAKPFLGCRPPITAHPSNLIHAIQTRHSYPPHTQSRIARDSASGPCKIFTPLGRLPSHLHIEGRRMRGLDLYMLVGLQLGPKHWSALSLRPPNSARCLLLLRTREPLSALHFALWEVFIFKSLDRRTKTAAGTSVFLFRPISFSYSDYRVWCARSSGSLGWSLLSPSWNFLFVLLPFPLSLLSFSHTLSRFCV